MVRRKGGHPLGVTEGDRKLEKPRLTRGLREGAGRAEASGPDLDRDLPGAGSAHVDGIGVLDRAACVGGEPPPLVPPDEDVGVEQQIHRPLSKSRITWSGSGASKSFRSR